MKKKYSFHNLIRIQINYYKGNFKKSKRIIIKGQIHHFKLEIMAKLCILILIIKVISMEWLRSLLQNLLALTNRHCKISSLKDNIKIDFY